MQRRVTAQKAKPSATLDPEVLVARRAIRKAVKSVRALDLPPFGRNIGSSAGACLADAVVAHRLLKHHPKNTVGRMTRKRETISKMLAYDTIGYRHSQYLSGGRFDYRLVPQPFRGLLLQAKSWLSKHFSKVPRSHRFRCPSGETYVPSQGRTSLLEKLSDPGQWYVSIGASKDAAAVCYHNHQLKRLVKDRFRSLYDPVVAKGLLRKWWNESSGNKPFWVFHRMFVDCCGISSVSRLSTVPKDGSKDRPISMEALWTMVAQLSYAADLKDQLRRSVGIDLESRSALHGTLVRHASLATIDFSNASNSNWLVVLEWLLPSSMFKKIMDLRTPICEFEGEYHQYNMMAPMGCGFTFEVMTIVLLALSRACDGAATVFGDDVILTCDKAELFMGLADIAGWVINEDKSFIDGSFRESCGVYYDVASDRRIVCYDLTLPDTIGDVILLANKLYRILEAKQISQKLRIHLLSLYAAILTGLPRVALRDHRGVHDCLPPEYALAPPQMVESHDGYSLMSRCIAFALQRACVVQTAFVQSRKTTNQVSEAATRSPAYSAFLRSGNCPKPHGELYGRWVRVDAHSGSPIHGIPLLSVLTGG